MSWHMVRPSEAEPCASCGTSYGRGDGVAIVGEDSETETPDAGAMSLCPTCWAHSMVEREDYRSGAR